MLTTAERGKGQEPGDQSEASARIQGRDDCLGAGSSESGYTIIEDQEFAEGSAVSCVRIDEVKDDSQVLA